MLFNTLIIFVIIVIYQYNTIIFALHNEANHNKDYSVVKTFKMVILFR
jgi:hypothetical protein